jgi:hypothetical protein
LELNQPKLLCRQTPVPLGQGDIKLVAKGGIEPLASGYEPVNRTIRLSAIALKLATFLVDRYVGGGVLIDKVAYTLLAVLGKSLVP